MLKPIWRCSRSWTVRAVTAFVASFGLVFFSMGFSAVPANAATVKLLTWDLVDGGKHIDWDSSSVYTAELKYGAGRWNAHKKGVIRQDSWLVIEDVRVTDYSKKNNVYGVTDSRGTIKFNRYTLKSASKTIRKNAATHELGHALGLGHNGKKDVMYAYGSNNIKLTANDKASYNAAYKRY